VLLREMMSKQKDGILRRNISGRERFPLPVGEG
jgi:hypothetical protein